MRAWQGLENDGAVTWVPVQVYRIIRGLDGPSPWLRAVRLRGLLPPPPVGEREHELLERLEIRQRGRS